MKKIFALIIMLTLVCSGAAYASEYTVYTIQKGDCLWKIGKKYNLPWEKIAKDNGIKWPWIIRIGRKLNIMEDSTEAKSEASNLAAKKTIKRETIDTINIGREKATASVAEESQIKEYNRDDVGTDMFTGTKEKAIMLLGFPAGSILKYDGGAPDKGRDNLKKGDEVWMTHGKNKVDHYKVNLDTPERSLRYQVLDKDGNFLGYAYWMFACFNWYRKIEPAPPKIDFTSSITGTSIESPTVTASKAGALLPPVEDHCAENELNAGVGGWKNGIAKGRFAWGEYMHYLKTSCESPYSFGIGIYGSWEDGESRYSDYKWKGYTFGPQIGVKRTWWNDDNLLRQWEIKLRFLRETNWGMNRESKYKFTQHTRELDTHSEYVHEFNSKLLGIITLDARYGFHRNRKSSWSDDRAENRGQFNLGFYLQYRMNEILQFRGGGGFFGTWWDDEIGLNFRLQARVYETLMIGPYVSLYPFTKSNHYRGISRGKLTTYGGGVHVETGTIFRKLEKIREGRELKRLDDDRFGVITIEAK